LDDYGGESNNAGFFDRLLNSETPKIIKDHTTSSLEKMVSSGGRIMTLDEFKEVYANSPAARNVAQKLVQKMYQNPSFTNLFSSREDAVNGVIEDLNEDAEDVYKEYMKQFTLIYNQDKDAVVKNADLQGFTPLSNFYTFNDAGAGVQSESIVATVDPAYRGDVQTQDYLDFYNKIVSPNLGKSSNGIEIYSGLGDDLSERRLLSNDPDPADSNEGALTALQALRIR